ncbi:phosphate ABC transporter permease PstA [Leptolyngbya sp. FACHB-261]|uniref:phosphate ABC transporter permease PstA n=1 Tax=Leptolyngbya sp. FACHB-261 TaxID=2692806 RepID=UPI001688C2CD|nr:phosphate ABC transporter permease PstA [Leptolyngbya sp. FACHB-261]MBD2101283.1 phosphate ABC transporter permease PstA [Leptolyngbya sp. FACHB-261]
MAVSFPEDSSQLQAGSFEPNVKLRERAGKIFGWICLLGLSIGLVVLALLLWDVLKDGLPRALQPEFLLGNPSRFARRAGLRPALFGSIWLGALMLLIAVPIGVGAALYLEEYAPKNWWSNIVEVNIANLAGVPSIVYGLLGLGVFNELLKFGPVLLSGALTLSLLALPLIIVASREAIRAVPQSLRQASYGLGATKWQTISNHVLPYAVPGILTGVIISISRAIGETAPLIVVGAVGFLASNPSLFSRFMALPILIYDWVSRPQAEFKLAAAAAIIVLLLLVLALNGIAIYIRNRFSTFK